MFGMLMKWMRDNKILPQISDTERQALEAGHVWVEGEFFKGNPDFEKMLTEAYDQLPEKEQKFLDGPVEELLSMMDGYKTARTRELDDKVMQFLKDNGFFAMQIPEEYGGNPLSTLGKSAVMAKISPVNGILSSLVVIPNSLGAAELLTHYGTDEQKNHYLPRLAKGDYIPCFGLTEPTAGSDAASMEAEGEVFRDSDGEIKFKLNFRKRYITLAPIANLISLACRLRDPDNLLGNGEDAGITVLLMEKGKEGLYIGDYHEPIGDTFYNGPIVGRDVIATPQDVLGGEDYIGLGWKMLMESLAGGRMVSLPAGAIGGLRGAAAGIGAYSMVRTQFGMPIGKMEGVEAKVGHAAGMNYMFEGGRVFGCSALDHGIQPPVASAIMKAYSTETAREVGTDAMDVFAGAGVMQGPNNVVGGGYTSAPVGITVEGANIMTRTLMIFGQGATRCHPHAYPVVQAVENNDTSAFRKHLMGWMGQFFMGFVLTLLRGITRGWFTVKTPKSADPKTHTWYRRMGWAATRFGLLTNLAMFAIGGKLKTRGNLTGRYADVLAWMYMALATLRRYEAEGRRAEDLPLVEYSCQYAMHQVQKGFEGIYDNFGGPLGFFLRTVGRLGLNINPIARPPMDDQTSQAASILQQYNEQYQRLTAGLYVGEDDSQGMGRLLKAFRLTTEAEPVRQKIRAAQKARKLPRGDIEDLLGSALEEGIISATEADLVKKADQACLNAVEVDVFTEDEFYGKGMVQGETATGDGGQDKDPDQEKVAKAS